MVRLNGKDVSARANAMSSNAERKWRVIDLITWTTGYFQKQEIPSARLDAELLLAYALGVKRLELYLRFQEVVSYEHLAQYRALIKQRAERIPLAYLTHEREFMGLSFYVDEHVLVPRPETETLVEIVEESSPQQNLSVLDIGTGSGVIAISLAKRKGWNVIATDVSAEAVNVAQKNAEAHAVSAQIDFRVGDLFEPVSQQASFDWIVSNPPYIRTTDLQTLQAEVRHEPRTALDGGEDGLATIRRLVAQAPEFLRPQGKLMIEMGHDHADMIHSLVADQQVWRSFAILRDYSKVDRFLLAERV